MALTVVNLKKIMNNLYLFPYILVGGLSLQHNIQSALYFIIAKRHNRILIIEKIESVFENKSKAK